MMGCQLSRETPTYNFTKILNKIYEIEEILGQRGHPLRYATGLISCLVQVPINYFGQICHEKGIRLLCPEVSLLNPSGTEVSK